MRQSRGRILVIRGGAIGDFILTLPAISALRHQFPEAHLEILGYPHIVQLALAGGLVDSIRSIEARALAGYFARHGQLEEDLADYFSEFDIIISYLYDPDAIFKTNIGRVSRAQFIEGPHRPKENENVHATQVFLKPLERLAIFEADNVPRLSLRKSGVRSTNLADGPVIALHPGSGSERKNWPDDKWAELIQELINTTNVNLLIVGGEAEGERLQQLAAALPPKRVRVAQSLPLPELGALLEQCAAFIGHDSGISHLAAALGLPGIILWADTPQEVWRPPSERVRVIHHAQGIGAITSADVFPGLGALIKKDDPEG